METNIEKVIDFLWLSRNEYGQRIRNGHKILFNAPLYGGLPKCMAEKLTPEEIKAIQSAWTRFVYWESTDILCLPFESKNEFANNIRYTLCKKLNNDDEEIVDEEDTQKHTAMTHCPCGETFEIKGYFDKDVGDPHFTCPECGKEVDLSKTYFLEETYEVILGDFLAWAVKNKWWLRGFESIARSRVGKAGEEKNGWSFVWYTSCGFVTDEDIRKEIKPKTASEWNHWGR
jgi:hypothetical protein